MSVRGRVNQLETWSAKLNYYYYRTKRITIGIYAIGRTSRATFEIFATCYMIKYHNISHVLRMVFIIVTAVTFLKTNCGS